MTTAAEEMEAEGFMTVEQVLRIRYTAVSWLIILACAPILFLWLIVKFLFEERSVKR
jgi:hypothetical protein